MVSGVVYLEFTAQLGNLLFPGRQLALKSGAPLVGLHLFSPRLLCYCLPLSFCLILSACNHSHY